MSITNLGPLSTPSFVKSLVLEWIIEKSRVDWIRHNAELRDISQLKKGSDLWEDIKIHGNWLFVYDFNENVIYYKVRK